MLAYLARYTHRVAIANSRLIAFDDNGVTFRWKDYRAKGRERHKIMTLASDEFIRRFLIHVLPSGFHRIRHYGLFANGGRAENLARARELLGVPPTQSEPADAERRRAADALAPMPVLRWPHDHHRDLRARLNAAHPSDEPDQDRHIMMPLMRARHPNAARLCRVGPRPATAMLAPKPHRRTLLRAIPTTLAASTVPRLGPPSPSPTASASPRPRPAPADHATTASATIPIARGTTERTCPAVSSPEASRTPAARVCGLVHQRQASENP